MVAVFGGMVGIWVMRNAIILEDASWSLHKIKEKIVQSVYVSGGCLVIC